MSLFFLPFIALSQTITVETQHFSEENGLSPYANYIFKDSRSLIWIGTQYGLYRLDGQNFTHFDEKSGLPFREIMEIYEDTEGWFWLFKSCRGKPNCEKNLAFFHPLTKETLTFEERFGEKVSIQASQIESVAGGDKQFFLTAEQKLLIWEAESGIREVPIKGLEKTPSIWTKINDKVLGGYFVINSNVRETFYLALDTAGHILQAPQKFPDGFSGSSSIGKKSFEFESIRRGNLEISFDENGALLVDTLPFFLPFASNSLDFQHLDEQIYSDLEGNFYHTDLGALKQKKIAYSNTLENFVVAAPVQTNLWIKTNDSEARYFQKFIGFRGIRHSFFDDANKTLWIANADGITAHFFNKLSFFHTSKKKEDNILSSGVIDIEALGLMMLTNKSGYFLNRENEIFPLKAHLKNLSILEKGKRIFFEKGQQHFWVSRSRVLFQINKDDFSTKEYLLNGEVSPIRNVITWDNHLLLAGKKGLFRLDLDSKECIEFPSLNSFEILQNAKVHFFQKISEHKLLIASSKGIFLATKKDGIIAQFSNTQNDNYYLPAQNFFHISNAKNGGYWLASMNGLIWVPDDFHLSQNESIKYRHYSTDILGKQQLTSEKQTPTIALPTNELLAAYEDDFGFVWMPTPHGLIQFQVETGLSKLYKKEDGLSSTNFQEYAHLKRSDGTLVFGGYNGFNIFHPLDFKEVDFEPDVSLVVTDFEQYSSSIDKIEDRLGDFLETQKIVLKPGDKFFNIKVVLADYRVAKGHRFAYKIEGFQEDWLEDRSNLIRVSGLPYGKYILKIRGRFHNDLLAEPILEIPVLVLKPFYLKTWFFISILVLISATLIFWYRIRTKEMRRRQAALEQAVTNATTTIRQQNEELKNLDKVKSRFFANVSHELRTPITLILGPLTSLVKSGELKGKSAHFAELGRKNARGLLNLVNEILDLTKMESGKIELKEEATQFYPFLDFLRSAFEGIAQQKNINYEFRYNTDKQLWLQLDPKKFEKLVNNLLSNAFKFTPPKGKISLQVEDKQDYLILAVQDSGRGIHPLDVPHVFDRFYQSAQPNTPKEGGTGIGLSLSMEFAKLMKGNLWVKSDLGKGSTFYFEFPKTVVSAPLPVVDSAMKDELESMEIKQEQERNTEAPHPITDNRQLTTENQQLEPLEPATILLVEDNDNLREYIQIIIGEHYEVFTAENGRVAWEFLRDELGEIRDELREMSDEPNGTHNSSLISPLSKTPDLIISDIMMPEMDGYQLLEKLKSSDRFRGVPIIMLTALADLKDKLKALRIGVDDYMTKPFEEEELLARVANLLKNSRERKAFYLQEKNTPAKKTNHNKTKTEKSEPNPTEVISFSEEDSQWLEHLEAITTKSIGNFNFSLEQLAHELASNRWSVRRRIKQLTGLTATQYLKEIRLNHARHLLEDKVPNSVKALAYEVGVKDVKYFSQQFKQRFGKSPSEYL